MWPLGQQLTAGSPRSSLVRGISVLAGAPADRSWEVPSTHKLCQQPASGPQDEGCPMTDVLEVFPSVRLLFRKEEGIKTFLEMTQQ